MIGLDSAPRNDVESEYIYDIGITQRTVNRFLGYRFENIVPLCTLCLCGYNIFNLGDFRINLLVNGYIPLLDSLKEDFSFFFIQHLAGENPCPFDLASKNHEG